MSKSINVLLVDDEELFVSNLSRVLTRRGMTVRGVNSGFEAIELLSEAEPGFYNVIVLDLKMPEVDGLATLQLIRERDPLIPVILLTGHADVKQVSQALREGVNEVLLKPCQIDTLVSTIENVHEWRGIVDEM